MGGRQGDALTLPASSRVDTSGQAAGRHRPRARGGQGRGVGEGAGPRACRGASGPALPPSSRAWDDRPGPPHPRGHRAGPVGPERRRGRQGRALTLPASSPSTWIGGTGTPASSPRACKQSAKGATGELLPYAYLRGPGRRDDRHGLELLKAPKGDRVEGVRATCGVWDRHRAPRRRRRTPRDGHVEGPRTWAPGGLLEAGRSTWRRDSGRAGDRAEGSKPGGLSGTASASSRGSTPKGPGSPRPRGRPTLSTPFAHRGRAPRPSALARLSAIAPASVPKAPEHPSRTRP